MFIVTFSFLQICNAVAVAALLNATLVLPRFLYSNVWKDPRYFKLLKTSKFIEKNCLLIYLKCVICSQFGDIYQEDHFIEYLKDEVNIVKDLPQHLKTTDNKNLSLVCFYFLHSLFFFFSGLIYWSCKIIMFVSFFIDY